MKKIIIKTGIVITIVLTLSLQSCNKTFNELAINPNQPGMNGYFTSPEAVNQAVVVLYGYISTQRCLGASGSKTTIVRSDEMSSNSDYGKPGMFGSDLNPSYYTIEQPYTLMYTTASQASFVIESIDKVDFKGKGALKNAYKGEAYFWRAFAHFYLLINWRNISPVRKMPETSADYVRPLEKPDAVWDFIIEDLKTAKELLPTKGFWETKNIGRVTKGSATAMLGKAYLYRTGIEKNYGESKVEFYNEAAKEFGEIIDGISGTYSLMSDFDWNFDVMHENNDESVFEIQFKGDVDNVTFNPATATSGLAFDTRGIMLPGTGVGYEGVVHDWLYNAFANSLDKNGNTDIRMFSTLMFNDLSSDIKLRSGQRLIGPGGKKWEEIYPPSGGKTGFQTTANTLSHSYKAGVKKFIDHSMPTLMNGTVVNITGVGAGVKQYVYNQPRSHGVNWRYIRLSDVYLMYAESVLNGGQQSSIPPLEAVNRVRLRANLASLLSVTMDDIKKERILELALEGHRFYDLLRWGELSTRFKSLESSDPNFKKFISTTDYKGFVVNKHEWLPIPINELNTNPNITQNNPGY
jgi:starch-binding outer membrane protein, SusD/RagB family